MKRTIYFIVATMMLSLAAIASRAAGVTVKGGQLTKEVITAMTPEQKQTRLEEINQRIGEIRAMDKSQLTRAERKELRVQLRDLKKEQADMVGIIYIGAGLIVFIGLLLIIFLR